MKKQSSAGIFMFIFAAAFWLIAGGRAAFANNVTIGNIALSEQNTTEKTVKAHFDVYWEHSWRNNINHDALWLFIKYSKDSGISWAHATLKTAGLNPPGCAQGTGTPLDIVVPSDCKGAFLRRSENGSGPVTTTGVKLVWDWNADGLAVTDRVRVRIFAVEMVYVGAGAFYAGDYAATAALKKGSADNDPWQITGESAIAVTNAVNHGTYYVSGGNSGEDPTGAVFTIPGAFPKGYNAFYAMKYEISEEAWAEFFSTLTDDQKSSRDITATTGKNSQGVVNRNTISWSGGDAATSRPDRACSFLSWMDLCAYADWAGLRPITELEYEKMCRGSCAPVAGEYAWGNTMITAAATLPAGNENGTETVLNASANACFGNTMFSQGDGGLGPLRCGIFAAASTSRRGAGAGYYGNMELSGNLAERVVTIGNAQGRSFAGSNGDGLLTVTTGHAGNATNTDWPGIDASPVNGVTGAAGAGFRGGDWSDDAAYLRVADRSRAALASAVRADTYGGRCARNAP